MKAKEYVLIKYPNSFAYPMIDNARNQTSYVIIESYKAGLGIFPNEGAKTASKAWTNAMKHIKLTCPDDPNEKYK